MNSKTYAKEMEIYYLIISSGYVLFGLGKGCWFA